MVESPFGQFAIFVGHVENGEPYPFEVWVNGNEQPRGLGAVAKTLSMDMRAQDQAWLRMKLDILARTAGDDAFDCPMPPDGKPVRVPSLVAAFARIVRYRVDQLGALRDRAGRQSRRCSTRCSRRRSPRPAPTARCRGRWTCTIRAPAMTSC